MKSVFLYPNMSKENINDGVLTVLGKLYEFDVEIYMSEEWKFEKVKNIDIDDFTGSMVITLGGDGTMLKAISGCKNIPILGINFGHLGFLTELEISELSYLEKIFNGQYYLDKRMTLNLDIFRDGVQVFKQMALNDIIVKTENSFRVVNIEVMSNGKSALQFDGDGVIIATPTGSTAYSLSAGGPIVEPKIEAICVTPICSHKLSGKSFVFSKDREITIKIQERNENIAYIAVDGNNNTRIYPDDIVKITKSSDYIPFIRVKGTTFFNVLKQKIGG